MQTSRTPRHENPCWHRPNHTRSCGTQGGHYPQPTNPSRQQCHTTARPQPRPNSRAHSAYQTKKPAIGLSRSQTQPTSIAHSQSLQDYLTASYQSFTDSAYKRSPFTKSTRLSHCIIPVIHRLSLQAQLIHKIYKTITLHHTSHSQTQPTSVCHSQSL